MKALITMQEDKSIVLNMEAENEAEEISLQLLAVVTKFKIVLHIEDYTVQREV